VVGDSSEVKDDAREGDERAGREQKLPVPSHDVADDVGYVRTFAYTKILTLLAGVVRLLLHA
jgi:hypothetical protein